MIDNDRTRDPLYKPSMTAPWYFANSSALTENSCKGLYFVLELSIREKAAKDDNIFQLEFQLGQPEILFPDVPPSSSRKFYSPPFPHFLSTSKFAMQDWLSSYSLPAGWSMSDQIGIISRQRLYFHCNVKRDAGKLLRKEGLIGQFFEWRCACRTVAPIK